LIRTTEQSLTTANSIPSSPIPAILALSDIDIKDKFAAILATIPASIEKALDCPPIREIVRCGASVNDLESCLAIEIVKASNLLTVSGNLRQGHALEIAHQLIKDFPNESFEDFCLMLRNGVKGKYPIDGKSDIFRFDMLVIRNWMKGYLEYKYQKIEDRMMKEKESIHQKVERTTSDWIQLLKDAVKKTDEDGPTKTQSQNLAYLAHVRAMTEKEIKDNGQIKPKFEPYPSTSKSEIINRVMHIEYLKANYDARTGEKLPTWQAEQEWIDSMK
jgi:hypothetical protein